MGLFDGLGRFVWGENEPEGMVQRSDTPQVPPPVQEKPKQSALVDEHGYKIIPEVTISHVKAHRDSDTMTVTAWIANQSDRPVRVDYLRVLGQKRVFQREVGPNKGFQDVIYKGPLAPNEYDSHGELVFRIKESDDLFENVYHVEFNRESDGKFTIEEFHGDGPIRDI